MQLSDTLIRKLNFYYDLKRVNSSLTDGYRMLMQICHHGFSSRVDVSSQIYCHQHSNSPGWDVGDE